MAFTVNDLRDLTELLAARPEWRAEVRRLVLTDDLLALPDLVRELAVAQQRTEQQIAALTAAQQRTEQRLERLELIVTELTAAQQRTEQRLERLELIVTELAAAQQRTQEQVTGLIAAQQRTQEQVADLTTVQERMLIDMAMLKGQALEQKYIKGAHGYFGQWLRRVRVVLPGSLDASTEDLLYTHLTREEVSDVFRLDALIKGVLYEPEARVEVYLAVEISARIDRDDVERATRRAGLLQRAGLRSLAVVAGENLTEGADKIAQEVPVIVLQNGRSWGWEKAFAAG